MAKHPNMSLHLSRALDEIGVNEMTVKKRRDTFLFKELVDSVHSEVSFGSLQYIFGSKTEGSTTLGLDSDIDLLYCHRLLKVLLDLGEWTEGPYKVLLVQENTPPGYCRLQLLKEDKPEPDTLPRDGFKIDECNRVVLMKSIFDALPWGDQNFPQQSRNGPAITWHIPGELDSDMTHALMCTSTLQATIKWAGRKRSGGWPTAGLIKQVVDAPFFIVPVGNKLSPTKDFEWRISMSLAERYLMFSLNIVQLKCYVILKILMATCVTHKVQKHMPEVKKTISSYHCKTALLYSIESTEADFWREENLIQGVSRCLQMLLAWVKDGFCPHFVIVDSNLFDGKVTSDNKGILHHVLRTVITNLDDILLQVTNLGPRLKSKLGTVPKRLPILDSKESQSLLGYLDLHIQFTLQGLYFNQLIPVFITDSIRKNKQMLVQRTNPSNKLHQEATGQAIMVLDSLLGSVLASESLGQHKGLSQEAIDLLDSSATSDIASLLKQASVFYCSGDLEKVEKLCTKIDDLTKRTIVFPFCYRQKQKCSGEDYIVMHTKKRDVRFANCVMFTQHEVHCVPQALRHELFKGVCDDVQNKERFEWWMVLAIVDCLPFLYYLQYMTYRHLGKGELQQQSLHNLERYIREDMQRLNHVETALNILGQCYEIEKQLAAALHCYRQSLHIRSRHNAANWLVPLLLYRCTQKESVSASC